MKISKILNSIWQEFVYGGHLLSLGFAGVVLSTMILLDVKIEWPILVVAYLISQISYTYNHFKEVETDIETNPERAEYLQKIKKYSLFFFIIYSLVFLIILIYSLRLKFFLFALFLFVIGILYTQFFKGLTKKIVGFKSLYVPFCWALGGAFLPFFYYSFSFSLSFILIFLFVFFRWIINTAFFDIKDIESDKKENLLTLPIQFGERKTLKYLQILNIISFFPILLGVFLRVIPLFSLCLIIFYFYSFYYLKKAEKIDQKDLRILSYVMVDGEYIFWPIVLFLGKSLI